ncbi:MAG: flagellar biosynthesis anti-sigma factor FlgM [Gammaproteobacteria bacterium]|nr:flagellar biosynthesis anti-sigma factor FlgM [Gammaproteobacteria bacterium]MBU1415426.1 flagellar biosynthesis anti-sigma factor FlgM [Gammaproteobacteria bacterium]
MKINPSLPSVTQSDQSGRVKPATQGSRRPSASEAEQVDLSSLSARLQEVSAAIANTPEVDTARIAEIKQAISEGRFQINPDRIAEGLLENVRQMLARQQQ